MRPISVTEAAEQLGVKPWTFRRLFTRGVLPEPGRVGGHRVLDADQLPLLQLLIERERQSGENR
jgi:excisionase family DNA binding protein